MMEMLGFSAHSINFGERIHIEQSLVGNVLSSCAILPPYGWPFYSENPTLMQRHQGQPVYRLRLHPPPKAHPDLIAGYRNPLLLLSSGIISPVLTPSLHQQSQKYPLLSASSFPMVVDTVLKVEDAIRTGCCKDVSPKIIGLFNQGCQKSVPLFCFHPDPCTTTAAAVGYFPRHLSRLPG